MMIRRAGDNATVCNHHVHINNVVTERTFNVMIFPVHIAANSSSHRDKLRSRCYREKPTLWHYHFKDFIESKPALTFKNAICSVEREYPVIIKSRNCSLSEGSIAITSAVSPWNYM